MRAISLAVARSCSGASTLTLVAMGSISAASPWMGGSRFPSPSSNSQPASVGIWAMGVRSLTRTIKWLGQRQVTLALTIHGCLVKRETSSRMSTRHTLMVSTPT